MSEFKGPVPMPGMWPKSPFDTRNRPWLPGPVLSNRQPARPQPLPEGQRQIGSQSDAAPGSAIVMEADAPALSAGQSVGVQNAHYLRNNLKVPIWVDEILVNLDPLYNGGDIRVQLRLEGNLITNGFLPVWLLGPLKNQNVVSNVNSQLDAYMYGARLAKPIVLMPERYVEASFYHAGVLNTSAITPRIILRGRSTTVAESQQIQQSSKRWLPWFSAFVGAFNVLNVTTTEQSTESQLVNPFPTPLQLAYMVGAIGDTGTTKLYFNTSSIDAGMQYLTVRISDQNGQPIVKDETPFGHLFQIRDLTWPVKAVMPPRSFYIAYLNEKYKSLNSTNKAQAMIGLAGFREVG